MLYKPEGIPSFENMSYVMDSDINIVARVIGEAAIN